MKTRSEYATFEYLVSVYPDGDEGPLDHNMILGVMIEADGGIVYAYQTPHDYDDDARYGEAQFQGDALFTCEKALSKGAEDVTPADFLKIAQEILALIDGNPWEDCKLYYELTDLRYNEYQAPENLYELRPMDWEDFQTMQRNNMGREDQKPITMSGVEYERNGCVLFCRSDMVMIRWVNGIILYTGDPETGSATFIGLPPFSYKQMKQMGTKL